MEDETADPALVEQVEALKKHFTFLSHQVLKGLSMDVKLIKMSSDVSIRPSCAASMFDAF